MKRLFLVLFSFSLYGCTSIQSVKVSELPKLNTSQTYSASSLGVVVTLSSTRHVQDEKGRMVQIPSRFDLLITKINGDKSRITYPVHSTWKDDVLTVRGGNTSDIKFHKDEIHSSQVESLDLIKTGLIYAGTVLVATLVIGGVTAIALSSNKDSGSSIKPITLRR